MSYRETFVIAAATLLHPGAACAEETYPAKPIRIVTTPAGGAADLAARLIAREIAAPLGQPVIIENRGGDIAIAAGIVAKAAPDGYTLLLHGIAFLVTPLLRQNPPYDPVRDFAPITMVATSPNVVVVHPSVVATSIREIIALAKARPGTLNYASAGTGSSAHLAAELFKTMAGVDIAHVPYKGTAPAVVDLVGGQVHLMFVLGGVATPHIKSGRLRALAV
ncbi:MAG TPA: tripartite tricarboxylate transporter substrate-binding protein, partial [Burkholderiales bacterium]|nr:tripartite tricarboxylate transporter substrate-binding protein [Burkholderiales bacterium]